MILDKFKLDGKAALVTGASSGIGQAIALAAAGADVACHSRSESKGAKTCAGVSATGRRAAAVVGEIAD